MAIGLADVRRTFNPACSWLPLLVTIPPPPAIFFGLAVRSVAASNHRLPLFISSSFSIVPTLLFPRSLLPRVSCASWCCEFVVVYVPGSSCCLVERKIVAWFEGDHRCCSILREYVQNRGITFEKVWELVSIWCFLSDFSKFEKKWDRVKV